MKLVSLKCPNCNGILEVNPELNYIKCPYCSTSIYMDDEVVKEQITVNGSIKIDGITGVSDQIRIANQYYKMGSYDDSLAIVNKILTIDPFCSEALVLCIKINLDNSLPDDSYIMEKIRFLENSDEDGKYTEFIKESNERLILNQLNQYISNNVSSSDIPIIQEKLQDDYRDFYTLSDKNNLSRSFQVILEILKKTTQEIEIKTKKAEELLIIKVIAFSILIFGLFFIFDRIKKAEEAKYNNNIKFIEKVDDLTELYSIGGEEFYVIDKNDKYTTLLSKYNLHVGNVCVYDDKYDGWSCEYLKDATLTQNYISKGYTFSDLKIYGVVYPYNKELFDDYLDSYKKILKKSYDVDVDIRLIMPNELEKFGCDLKNKNCEKAPFYITNVSYYTDYSLDEKYCVFNSMPSSILEYDDEKTLTCGIRPVIIVKTSILPKR